jgi:hypothetical protein
VQQFQSSFSPLVFICKFDCLRFVGCVGYFLGLEGVVPIVEILGPGEDCVGDGEVEGLGLGFCHLRFGPFLGFLVGCFGDRFGLEFVVQSLLLFLIVLSCSGDYD